MVSWIEEGQRMWRSGMGGIINSALLVGATSAELVSTVNTCLAKSPVQCVVVLQSLERKGIEFAPCGLGSL